MNDGCNCNLEKIFIGVKINGGRNNSDPKIWRFCLKIPQYCYYYYYIRIIFIKIEQNYVQAVLKKVVYSILLSVIRFSGGFSSHLREKAKHLIWRRRYSLPSTPSNRPITYSCKVRSEDYYLLLSTFIHYYPLLLSTTIIIHYYYYPLLLLSTIGTASIQSL